MNYNTNIAHCTLAFIHEEPIETLLQLRLMLTTPARSAHEDRQRPPSTLSITNVSRVQNIQALGGCTNAHRLPCASSCDDGSLRNQPNLETQSSDQICACNCGQKQREERLKVSHWKCVHTADACKHACRNTSGARRSSDLHSYQRSICPNG
jgi:hypothetical protein